MAWIFPAVIAGGQVAKVRYHVHQGGDSVWFNEADDLRRRTNLSLGKISTVILFCNPATGGVGSALYKACTL